MAKRIFNKRTLAVLLTVIMVFNLTGFISVFAAQTNQVMEGYYILDAQGNTIGTTDAATRTENGFTVSKTIAQTGENQFDITLKVVTSQEVVASDAAVQLVIDTSSSMQYCSEDCGNRSCGRHDSRLAAVKSILTGDNGFLDSLTAGNSGKVYVSVVTFGKNASTVCDWTDIKESNGLATVKNAINGLGAPDNATNMHAGLMLARNRLRMSTVANINAKFTVVLGDGYANCVGSESDSTTSIALSGRTPSSASATDAGTNGAVAMAATLKTMGQLYTVGYGVEESYLQGIFGNTNVYVGNSAASVTAAFANIAQSAVNGMNGAGSTVTDPMGEFVVMGDVSSLGATGVGAANGILTWKLNPANAQQSVSGNVTTYTYEITYPITLDTGKDGFQENTYYPTNGYTYLSVPTDNGTVNIAFNVPAVCGERPLFSVSYQYVDQIPAGAPALPATQTYKAGQNVQVADAPTLENYTFSGWSMTDFVMPAENVVITGSWNENPKYDYTLTYNANFGLVPATENDEQNISGTYAVSHIIDVNKNMFERANHTFIGWAETPDGAVVYAVGDRITFAEGGSKTLYAQWIEHDKYAYTVIYNGNGGALAEGALAYGDAENVESTYAKTHNVAVDENSFIRENYTFIGWSAEPQGQVVYAADDVIALSAQDNTRTLYAQWQINEYDYTVRYVVRVDDGAYAPFAGTLPADAPTGGKAVYGQILDADTLTGIPAAISDSNHTYAYTALDGIQIPAESNVVTVYYTYVTPVVPSVTSEEPPVTPVVPPVTPTEPPVTPPVVEIPEEPVPLAPAPAPTPAPAQSSGLVDIPDEQVPLASVPKTGDPIILYAGMTLLSGLGLLGLNMKKKEDEEA